MFARTSTVEGTPENVEQGIRFFQENVLPALKGAPGYKGALLLVDRQSGKGLGISVWDSEDNMQASEDAVRTARDQAAQTMGGSVAAVDHYEVAIYETQ